MRAPRPDGNADVEWRLFKKEAEALLKSPDADDAAADAKKTERETQPAADSPAAPAPNAANAQEQSKDSPAKPAVEAHFAIRAFGMGQLVRISTADPYPGTEAD